jgi:hypothetical protein
MQGAGKGKMPSIDFGPWAPDLAAISPTPYLRDAQGCLPAADHYRPLPGLTATTGALGTRCRGVYAARDKDNAAHMYAGDSINLFELESSGWTDRSAGGGDYTEAGSTTRWRFVAYGDRLIATNGLDAPQYIDMSTAATEFATLAGSPGIAKYIAVYLEFVFLAAISTSGMAIKWSALGNSESWTPGTGQSDEQEFADGGAITGMIATKAALYVFQEKCVRRVLYVGGAAIMQIDKLFDNIGCIEPNSLVSYGQRCFFLSENGWFGWDFESQPQPIGFEKFDRWFIDNSNRGYWYSMSAAIDPKNHIVAIGFSSTNAGSDTPDHILYYNFELGRPTHAAITHEILAPAISTFVSIDDLTGDVDVDYSISFDDPFWQGGAFYFGAFDTDHKLASFSGANVAAIFETSEASLYDGRRASVEWLKPIADTTDATAAAGAKTRPGDTITFQGQVSQQASGRCPQRGANGFFHAAKVQIPASATWTYARGVELGRTSARGVR